jgi:RNA polymerase sigma-70 factor (ECF subfamily)
MADPKASRPAIERLLSEQYSALTGYFRRRARRTADVHDLAQEVYLRMLRVTDPDSIENPEGYLVTVAANLLREQAVRERRAGTPVELSTVESDAVLAFAPTFEQDLDTDQRSTRLREVLDQLSPKCRAAVVLQYQHDWSYAQIAEHLGVSVHMVKKYLAQGLAHCRRRMTSLA